MTEAELSTSIENEIAAHLRHVQLLGMPDLAPKGEANVGPNHPWRSDGRKAFTPELQASVAPTFRIGEPQVGMAQVRGEAFEMVRATKRDDGDLSIQVRYLLVELPQLREMLLAIESTQVAEQNQNGRPPQQPACVENLAVKSQELEVKVDLHSGRS